MYGEIQRHMQQCEPAQKIKAEGRKDLGPTSGESRANQFQMIQKA